MYTYIYTEHVPKVGLLEDTEEEKKKSDRK
jgi:hypothetical protein